MTRTDLVEILDHEPFEPVRLFLADGASIDIVDPELVVPMDRQVFIARADDSWKLVWYFHITRVETLAQSA